MQNQKKAIQITTWWKRLLGLIGIWLILMALLAFQGVTGKSFAIDPFLCLLPTVGAMHICFFFICKERALLLGYKDPFPFGLWGFFGGIWGMLYVHVVAGEAKQAPEPALLQDCPHCGHQYNPADYRQDVTVIQCESCRKEIQVR